MHVPTAAQADEMLECVRLIWVNHGWPATLAASPLVGELPRGTGILLDPVLRVNFLRQLQEVFPPTRLGDLSEDDERRVWEVLALTLVSTCGIPGTVAAREFGEEVVW